ncbi:hypothetical protein KN1_11490 [Stygiolobus caldivivus]|uniref:Uncharacterized protein n=1 Tax=Stygiolobus caldivivus TaxID=2824673 RepID=A0A8D5U5X4_9CREN|nr:hypothetical protein KN1_11490 [Stygiolobus caldivivus]
MLPGLQLPAPGFASSVAIIQLLDITIELIMTNALIVVVLPYKRSKASPLRAVRESV